MLEFLEKYGIYIFWVNFALIGIFALYVFYDIDKKMDESKENE